MERFIDESQREFMNTSKQFVQAYRQAPWRTQTQRATMVLIVLFMGAAIFWLMLTVSVQTGAAGIEIQGFQQDKEDLQRQIADLRTQYANLTSANRMLKEAKDKGFEQVKPENMVYMVVPDYSGRQPVIQALPPNTSDERPLIKPVYTESLWEFMLQGITRMSEQPGGLSP